MQCAGARVAASTSNFSRNLVLKPNSLVFIIYALFSLLNAYARASARLFMTQHALLPRDMLSTICYNQESDERAALGELRATKWSPDKTLRSRTAHKRITHGGCTCKDDEYRCTYPIQPLSPAAGYLRSGVICGVGQPPRPPLRR